MYVAPPAGFASIFGTPPVHLMGSRGNTWRSGEGGNGEKKK